MLFEGIEINAQPLGNPGTEVLDHHIRIGHQLIKTLTIRRVLEIDFNAALAPVNQPEIHALAIQKRPQVPGIIALLRHFELDDVGPQIREHRRAMRPCQHATDVQHAHALQLSGKWTAVHFYHLGVLMPCRAGVYQPLTIGRFRPCSLAQSMAMS